MSCHHYRNFRFIGVMFWAFPYLLWQAFGHGSGFVVGLILAVTLTIMFNNLFRRSTFITTPQIVHRPVQMAEPQPRHQEAYRAYEQGYRAEMEPYRAEQEPYEPQPQYEEMQVQYPQEMPPMEQR